MHTRYWKPPPSVALGIWKVDGNTDSTDIVLSRTEISAMLGQICLRVEEALSQETHDANDGCYEGLDRKAIGQGDMENHLGRARKIVSVRRTNQEGFTHDIWPQPLLGKA